MIIFLRVVAIDSIYISARQLVLSFDDYKKHPCLTNHSFLMDCFDDFVGNFNSFEDFVRADIVNSKLRD